ncbi:hypothetical protein GCM10011495_39580 [Hymenobacter frigidus]|uniref:SUKH-3 domain-containing protein n=1 Tax=Hymenobacter frigidus TaxID=1524095 RepID=A0ABQ2AJL3_9BACT|nr:SUKH-3 domain-containing protein [Hymenobacter frigidus]GGH91448.1 hypothetical protein GCM10011495_39580 [Hymenobacter frigidus]
MGSFSASTLASLSQAGWQAGRNTDTLSYRLCLAAEGYAWFPAVAAFLGEFGGLALTFPRHHQRDTVHFHACQASVGVDARWVRDDYARRLGNRTLCVIGAAYSDHLVLFMDDAGQVYGGYDDFLCEVAGSGPAAIEALVSNQPLPEIQ